MGQTIWEKALFNASEKRVNVQIENDTLFILSADTSNKTCSLQSFRTEDLSPLHHINITGFFTDLVISNDTIFLLHSENSPDTTSIVALNSNGSIISTLSWINSSHAAICSDDTFIYVIDNHRYQDNYDFIRVARLHKTLEIDSTIFVARDEYQTGRSIETNNSNLYISGHKTEGTNEAHLDIKLSGDFIEQYSHANEIATSVKHETTVLIPNGIVAAYSIHDSIIISVKNFEGTILKSFYIASHNPQAINLEYFNNTIIIHIKGETSSELHQIDLNGSVFGSWSFVPHLEKITCSNHYVYTFQQETDSLYISKLDLSEPGNCTLQNGTITLLNHSMNSKNYEPTLIETNLETTGDTFSATTTVPNTPFTLCPKVSRSNPGDSVVCQGDSIELLALGDEGYVWIIGDDTLSNAESFYFTPIDDTELQLIGTNGHIRNFQIIRSKSGECKKELNVYNYITPNGDGDNEFFFVDEINYHTPISLKIYNLDNQEVFSTDDYSNDWPNHNQSSGEYLYYIETENTVQEGKLIIVR